MITKTLDEALRARGKEKMVREIMAATEPTMNLLRIGHGLTVKADGGRLYVGEQGKAISNNAHPLEAHEVLDMLRQTIIENRRERAEQDEVDGFIAAVGELRNSVDELCAGLPE